MKEKGKNWFLRPQDFPPRKEKAAVAILRRLGVKDAGTHGLL